MITTLKKMSIGNLQTCTSHILMGDEIVEGFEDFEEAWKIFAN